MPPFISPLMEGLATTPPSPRFWMVDTYEAMSRRRAEKGRTRRDEYFVYHSYRAEPGPATLPPDTLPPIGRRSQPALLRRSLSAVNSRRDFSRQPTSQPFRRLIAAAIVL